MEILWVNFGALLYIDEILLQELNIGNLSKPNTEFNLIFRTFCLFILLLLLLNLEQIHLTITKTIVHVCLFTMSASLTITKTFLFKYIENFTTKV